jgi:hypothetical protein
MFTFNYRLHLSDSKSPAMKFGPLLDVRSITLCSITYLLNILNNIHISSMDMKTILSIIALLSGITTVGYNAIKFITEAKNFFIGLKWKKKRKTELKKFQDKLNQEREVDNDVFD